MKTQEMLGADLSDEAVKAAIKAAQEQGMAEIKLGEALIKLSKAAMAKLPACELPWD